MLLFLRDISKHKVLDIPTLATTEEQGRAVHVLSVGLHQSGAALVTIRENNGAVAYQLPEGRLHDWAVHSVNMARQGLNAFPSDIEFGKLPTGYYAEIL